MGCSTLQGFLFPNSIEKSLSVSWEKDLRFQINDKIYYGTALVHEKPNYWIYIFPPYNEISRLQWRTCHRGGAAKNAVKYGKWPWSKKQEYYKMNFVPRDIERERACALKFEALAKNRKVMGFGMVVFPDIRPWFNLSSTVECNGEVHVYTDGTSICQAPEGAITRISFSGKTYMDDSPNSQCPPFKEISDGVFEFKMPKDECIYNFKRPEKHESGRYRSHKLVTFGYEDSPPPEDL